LATTSSGRCRFLFERIKRRLLSAPWAAKVSHSGWTCSAHRCHLGIESSPSFVRQPEGNGCVERFIRTLKEQLLWLRRFGSVAELDTSLREFRDRLNQHWIIGRIGYRTPAQHRRELLVEAA
jgi:transposase InsO family protein